MLTGNCAECGEESGNSGWTIGDKEYCSDCGSKLLEKESEIIDRRRMREARLEAQNMANILGRNVYVIEACPDRPLPRVFKRPAFLLEPADSFGGCGFRPDGTEITVERR